MRWTEAIRITIRICKEENVLRAYLKEREKEVSGIMFELYDEEYVQMAYGNTREKEGYEKGLAEGLAEGREKGQTEERMKNICSLKESGFSDEEIVKFLHVTPEEVREAEKFQFTV